MIMSEHQIKFRYPKVKVKQSGNMELLEDWAVQYNGWTIIVHAGFISDGNSVPCIFRGLVPKFGRNTIAGIVHDWLYYSGKVWDTRGGGYSAITRKEADIVRMNLCRECGVWWVERLASYIGLRIGGWVTWRRYRKRQPN